MTKKTTKDVSKKTASSYDWTSQFNKPKVRKAITKMVCETACIDKDGCLLQADMSPEMFANTLLVYVPKAYKYVPKGLIADEAKQKALVLLAELAQKNDSNAFSRWTDPDPNIACALILMMSKGVKSLDFNYSGGTDEISYDDCCSVVWHDGTIPLKGKDDDYKVKSDSINAYHLIPELVRQSPKNANVWVSQPNSSRWTSRTKPSKSQNKTSNSITSKTPSKPSKAICSILSPRIPATLS
jgi:hypothetical protein